MGVYLDETEEDFRETRKLHLNEALTPLQAAANELVQLCDLQPAVSVQLEEMLIQCYLLLRENPDE
jgi:hypothetical protein